MKNNKDEEGYNPGNIPCGDNAHKQDEAPPFS